MGTPHEPCGHTGLQPFPIIFWLWAFQNNILQPTFRGKLSQLFQCYLLVWVFLHRKPWLSSILFHQVNHYFEVLTKILPLLIHQCLNRDPDSWSLMQLLTHETSLTSPFRPIAAWLFGDVEISSELPCSRAVTPQTHNFASKQILTDQFYCVATWWIRREFKHHTKKLWWYFKILCSFSYSFYCVLVREKCLLWKSFSMNQVFQRKKQNEEVSTEV